MATPVALQATPVAEYDTSVELIFLGTGTSSSLPHIECLTASPDEEPCQTCISTLQPEGKKNIRRNTSAVFRLKNKQGERTTIVVDVGKNFQAAAIEWFPKYGLRRIDAVLITHAHADAMNGLDDLRGWTLHCAIQPHINIYLSQATFVEVQRSFPYLVSKEFASGGGDVPEFKWHIIDDRVPFEIEDTGIQITPFAVHHGRLFSIAPPPPVYLPSPTYTAPSTPISGRSTPQFSHQSLIGCDYLNGSDVSPKIHPYISYGFKVQDAVVYISDTSFIPEETWSFLEAPRKAGGEYAIPVFVVDCLRPLAHTSHFGLRESMDAVRRLGAKRSYLTGFGHEVTHDEYVTILQSAGRRNKGDVSELQAPKNVRLGIELVGGGDPVWVRPAFDSLNVVIASDGSVTDGSY